MGRTKVRVELHAHPDEIDRTPGVKAKKRERTEAEMSAQRF
jgi:hypothetical protein